MSQIGARPRCHSQTGIEIYTGEDYSMSTLEPNEGVSIALNFDSEPIWVALITRG